MRRSQAIADRSQVGEASLHCVVLSRVPSPRVSGERVAEGRVRGPSSALRAPSPRATGRRYLQLRLCAKPVISNYAASLLDHEAVVLNHADAGARELLGGLVVANAE